MDHALPILPKITIRVIDDASLETLAISHYESRGCKPRALGKGHSIRRKGKNTDAFLARIKVNYVRQLLSNYDHDKENAYRSSGQEREASCMSQQLYSAIAQHYPSLAAECERQIAQRNTL
ncbi:MULTISPECIES: hypothetical protein [Enterobacterales]|uniref:Uncharacterized protein n=4 Tax=Morganellaceae TaxID=1903414 RepID=A0A899NHS7_PROST|nr:MULTISPECIES: hypothetical protein [Enterobacterales]URQ57589.1 Hypothetical protein [Providencia alcalifaciens]EKH6498526.1 hypothetical protein [Providencia rettgeri]ELB1111353.1 hypothetical protein [Morganella morganii]ELL8907287.1 hypothetical protein [Proteus mirabilis]ELQ1458485.1 hypothetical protein [Providencia rettgeri]